MSTISISLHPVTAPLSWLAGQLVRPGDQDYDQARQAWNLAVDQRPAAVILPESAADVAAAVSYAAAGGLRIAAQGTGHNAGPLGVLDDTVLLRTGRMRGIQINPRTRTARVEAGVVWLDVVHAAAAHGLAALAGSSPDVGVAGYTLGGGSQPYPHGPGAAGSRGGGRSPARPGARRGDRRLHRRRRRGRRVPAGVGRVAPPRLLTRGTPRRPGAGRRRGSTPAGPHRSRRRWGAVSSRPAWGPAGGAVAKVLQRRS